MFLSKHCRNIASLRIGKHWIAKESEHRPPLTMFLKSGTRKKLGYIFPLAINQVTKRDQRCISNFKETALLYMLDLNTPQT